MWIAGFCPSGVRPFQYTDNKTDASVKNTPRLAIAVLLHCSPGGNKNDSERIIDAEHYSPERHHPRPASRFLFQTTLTRLPRSRK